MFNNQQKISLTRGTPEVIFDPEGTIKLTGRLIPENAKDFFSQLEELMTEYFPNPVDISCVEICLEYINSTGSKYLLDIIRKIIHGYPGKTDKTLIINWYYHDEDEDILEKGKIFSSIIDLPFNYIKIL